MSTTKTRRSLSLLAAFAVAAGALALPAATSATQAAPAFGVVAAEPAAPSLVDLDTSKTGSITIHKYVKDANNGTMAGNGLEDTSDHGTALDLAGTGRADHGSLLTAIQVALDMAEHWQHHRTPS